MNSPHSNSTLQLTDFIKPRINSIDASMLLMALPASKVNDDLYLKVRGSNNHWIQENPLYEISLRLLAISVVKPAEINGEITGLLIKRLITSELKTGGPYADDGFADFTTNAVIAQFLLSLNIKLPNLIEFIVQKAKTKKRVSIEDFWFTNWPNKIYESRAPKTLEGESLPAIAAYTCLNKIEVSNRLSSQDLIQLEAKNIIYQLNKSLQKETLDSWIKISRADKNKEISHISQYFEQSIIRKTTQTNNDVNLGIANFHAWMAYSLYDDLIDGEGLIESLPAANAMHRYSLIEYISLFPKEQDFIIDVYNLVDSANSWELKNCRQSIINLKIDTTEVPDFRDGTILAERAYGHVLGPLLIARSLNLTKPQNTEIHNAFTHYLIARQLNDDLHDWKEDLRNGRMTFVTSHLINNLGIKNNQFDLEELISNLELFFWDKGLESVSKIITEHIEQSLRAFESTGIFDLHGPFFTKILSPMKSGVEKGLNALNDRKIFLLTYTKY